MDSCLFIEVKDLISRILNTDPEKRYHVDRVRTHPWYMQVTSPTDPERSGFRHRELEPISEVVTSEMLSLGYDLNRVVKSVMNQSHDHYHATYQLLLFRHKQGAGSPDVIRHIAGSMTQREPAHHGITPGFQTQRDHVPHHPVVASLADEKALFENQNSYNQQPQIRKNLSAGDISENAAAIGEFREAHIKAKRKADHEKVVSEGLAKPKVPALALAHVKPSVDTPHDPVHVPLPPSNPPPKAPPFHRPSSARKRAANILKSPYRAHHKTTKTHQAPPASARPPRSNFLSALFRRRFKAASPVAQSKCFSFGTTPNTFFIWFFKMLTLFRG